MRALDPCAIGEWGGGIDPEITREGEKWQLTDIVVQTVDQDASAALVHPAITRLDRLLRLLTGLPDAKGDHSGFASFGGGERDKPWRAAMERQELGLRPTQEFRHLRWSRGDGCDLGILHWGSH